MVLTGFDIPGGAARRGLKATLSPRSQSPLLGPGGCFVSASTPGHGQRILSSVSVDLYAVNGFAGKTYSRSGQVGAALPNPRHHHSGICARGLYPWELLALSILHRQRGLLGSRCIYTRPFVTSRMQGFDSSLRMSVQDFSPPHPGGSRPLHLAASQARARVPHHQCPVPGTQWGACCPAALWQPPGLPPGPPHPGRGLCCPINDQP